ncbi:Protein of unknown function [Bacillus cereus]|nr:Protein of unknown function [Bacillus cereus]
MTSKKERPSRIRN